MHVLAVNRRWNFHANAIFCVCVPISDRKSVGPKKKKKCIFTGRIWNRHRNALQFSTSHFQWQDQLIGEGVHKLTGERLLEFWRVRKGYKPCFLLSRQCEHRTAWTWYLYYFSHFLSELKFPPQNRKEVIFFTTHKCSLLGARHYYRIHVLMNMYCGPCYFVNKCLKHQRIIS